MTTTTSPIRIPAELCGLQQFVLWKREKRQPSDDVATKIPYSVTGYRARSNDSTTWASLPEVWRIYQRGGFDGVGFMFAVPYVGVDLDACRNSETGVIVPRAAAIVDRFSTYSEISPSLAGVKMICRGVLPTEGGRGKNYRRDPWGSGAGGVEFYQRGRFFALTGRRLENSPAVITDGTAALADLYRELYPPIPVRPTVSTRTCDVMIADRVRRGSRYLAKLPASISGQGGHGKLLHAACTLIRFGLDGPEALDLLHEFNRRALPPWDDSEISRKLSEARKVAGHEFGAFLEAPPASHRQYQPRRRRIILIGGQAA